MVFSTMGDIMSTVGVILSTMEILSNVEDIMSTVGVFSTVGDILLLFEYSMVLNTPRYTHDIPHGTEYPMVLKITSRYL